MNLNTVIEKPSNLFIVALEGLDASGKETFANSLYHYMEEFDWEGVVFTTQVGFPRYSTEIGKMIKNILMTPHEDRDNKLLDDLMFYDRIEMMTDLCIQARGLPNTIFFVILDRYYFSNFVYSAQDSYTTQKKFELEASTLPKPNIVVHFIPETEKGKEIHKKQIEEKEEKDLNEVYEFQEYLMKKYVPKLKYSMGYYMDWDKATAGAVTGDITIQMTNDIGSNYGNLNKESEIVSIFKSWANKRGLL